jgi:arginine repressor
MIAIVDVLKKRPNLLQKEIIDVVLNEYGVKGLNQTSISRYLKRIYDMKQHVNTLIQAQKEGHILF